MKKIAIVCQRYGEEVNGGAEYHARLLAEKLSANYELQVLTTTALDYHTWNNHYAAGTETINGITVKRFEVITATPKQHRKSRRIINGNRKYFKILRSLHLFKPLNKYFNLSKVSKKESIYWLKSQGPYCPELPQYLTAHEQDYSVFIFFTYLYFPTAVGMPLVKEKAIFIPTAHDEPPLYLPPYENLFSVPRFIMYNSPAEKRLVEGHFKSFTKACDIAGVGFTPYVNQGDNESLKFNFEFKYFLYIGRIEINKGCDELLEYFRQFAKDKPIKLVLVGKDIMNVQEDSSIIKTGFISENEKYHLLQNCEALIIPSKFESLSMVTLEAMQAGKIVLANGKCEVLKDHIVNSKSGFLYHNFEEFSQIADKVIALTAAEKQIQASNAITYVNNHYSWDRILEKFDKAIQYVSGDYKDS